MGFLGMTTINEQLAFLVLQFLKEQGYNETAHTYALSLSLKHMHTTVFTPPPKTHQIVCCLMYRLERESGFYFDIKYLEDMVLWGKWDETERYLSGFTHFSRNTISDVCLWIRAQEYFEAIEK